MNFDLVVLGNLMVDDIVDSEGDTRMGQPGGAALYTTLAALLWDLRVGVVSRAGEDFPQAILRSLSRRGVDLEGVRTMSGPGLRTWLLYEGHTRRVVHRLGGATHCDASPTLDQIPGDWRVRAFHIAPMPFEHQLVLTRGLADRYGDHIVVSLDPFEQLHENRLEAWRELLAKVDILFVGEDEMSSPGATRDPGSLLVQLGGGRLRYIFYKLGPRGGVALGFDPTSQLEWSGRAETVGDTTGAGDAFAAGVLAGLLERASLAVCLHRGVVSASFAIEGQGSQALLTATAALARQRLRTWFPL